MTDPLQQTTDAGRTLFHKVCDAANGFPEDAVFNAAVNLMLNVIRQRHPTRAGAEKEIDALMGRAKALLLDQHYEVSGKRRNVFPFNQTIRVP